ncbi:MAG: trypsin-like serine protease [bacterium]
MIDRKLTVIVIIMAILTFGLFFGCEPALAISNGVIDGDRHPNVGALVIELKGTNIKCAKCSGVLINPNTFLTSGHCFSPAAIESCNFLVTFDSQFNPISGEFIKVKEFFIDPDFGHDKGDLHDMAVVILPEGSTEGIKPAELPAVNLLGEMNQKHGLFDNNFINVGYGVEPEWKGGPLRILPFDGYRRMSISPFMALTKSWLFLLMNNDATDQGGICYGDSGGPHFLEENQNLVVAITSLGDCACRSLSYNYRLDTPSAREFLSQFVTLP